ncbi:MAG: acyl-CoA thioesterase [Proteobacteria bacterium]|nr:acyl-CoA thioesterase [Pseudomonadota bacterium]
MTKASMASASLEIEIPFYDVDPMEIVWHGNYVKYFEKARYHLLDLIAYNYKQMQQSGYAWPVVDLRVKYIKSIIFAQKINVRATIVESEYGLKIDFLITDSQDGTRLCTGFSKQVAIDMKRQEMCLTSPAILHEKLAAYGNTEQ